MALARPDMKEGPGWTWRTQSNKKTNHVSAKHVSANMLLQQDMFELTCCKQVFSNTHIHRWQHDRPSHVKVAMNLWSTFKATFTADFAPPLRSPIRAK